MAPDRLQPVQTAVPPPHDLDAEESLLGSCMLSREAITVSLNASVEPADFYKPLHAAVYRAILETHAAGEHPDTVVLAARMTSAGVTFGDKGAQGELLRIQGQTPASMNAPAYARIVRDHATRRRIMATASIVLEVARAGGNIAEAAADLTFLTVPSDPRLRIDDGATFTFGAREDIPAVWGHDDRILWAEGESLLTVGPPGVGKTTVAAQLVAASVGIINEVLKLPVAPAARTLYLACDRPSQIQRAFHRLFGLEEHRDLLAERLVVWKGPPPRDFGKHPETLHAMCVAHGADRVFIDSLKDVAIGLSDDEIGAGLNSAIQIALAEGIQVMANHHQRKGQAGAKPRTLEDVYGSTWITAGAGSVVLLWGEAGDSLVELVHLKQPAAIVGPIQIEHDHNIGISTISRGDVDPLRILRQRPNGMTSTDLARIATGKDKPTENQGKAAKRQLERLTKASLAYRIDGTKGGGAHGTEPDRYYATTPEPKDSPIHIVPPPDNEERF